MGSRGIAKASQAGGIGQLSYSVMLEGRAAAPSQPSKPGATPLDGPHLAVAGGAGCCRDLTIPSKPEALLGPS